MERMREELSSVTDLQKCQQRRRRRYNLAQCSSTYIFLVILACTVSRGINCDELLLLRHQQLHGSQAVVQPSSSFSPSHSPSLNSSPSNFPSTQSSASNSSVTDPGTDKDRHGTRDEEREESSNGQQERRKGENEEKQRSYDGYTVLRLTPKSSDQLNFLQRLSVNDSKLDFWTRPVCVNGSVDVMVPPTDLIRLEKSLRRLNIDKLLMIDDVQRVVKKEQQSQEEGEEDGKLDQEVQELFYRTPSNSFFFPSSSSSSSSSPYNSFSSSSYSGSSLSFAPPTPPSLSFFDKYQRIDSVHNFLESLAQAYPEIVSIMPIGKSSEGRDLKVIKIGSKNNVKDNVSFPSTSSSPLSAATNEARQSISKPAIYLDAGLHAREWISVSTALYVAHALTHDYDVDPDIRRLVDSYDFYIHPVANPDGYEWTHSRDRLWRKTRSRNGLSFLGCRGVDPNRNFDYHWNEVGASDSPCQDVFAGPRAFSEPETRAIADFILGRKDQIKLFIALHSYSQLWLTPWGFTGRLPDTYTELKSRAEDASAALSKRYGTRYKVGSATNMLYAAAGGADDWAFGVAKIPYVYTVELRDTGKYGFLLPKEQIIPTGEEFMDGFKQLALDIL